MSKSESPKLRFYAERATLPARHLALVGMQGNSIGVSKSKAPAVPFAEGLHSLLGDFLRGFWQRQRQRGPGIRSG